MVLFVITTLLFFILAADPRNRKENRMTSEAITIELAFRHPKKAIRYLEKKRSRASDTVLESIIDAHLWRKSTALRLLREKCWLELAGVLGDAYIYHTDALFRSVQGDGRPRFTPSECVAYGERCLILGMLADIVRARIPI